MEHPSGICEHCQIRGISGACHSLLGKATMKNIKDRSQETWSGRTESQKTLLPLGFGVFFPLFQKELGQSH